MLQIRTATQQEFTAVRAFYHSLIDAMQTAPHKPSWQKEIYPSDAYLQQSIAQGTLYIGLQDGEIAAAMILNHQCSDGYQTASWRVTARPEEVTIIHTLGVHARFSGRGFGKALMAYATRWARDRQQKAIRLDVEEGNLPAEKLYQSLGFQFTGTMSMHYPGLGDLSFHLYEYPLQ